MLNRAFLLLSIAGLLWPGIIWAKIDNLPAEQSNIFDTEIKREEPQLNKIVYKEKIRSLLTVQFKNDYQIGLDSFKVGSLQVNQLEMASLEPSLHTKSLGSSHARGYGVKFKMNLD